ncbi:unnamed protein product [Ambrosiozyma monospora]|uniref:Unnamed protein product n=1 Tax=Ambrosiozyma monospora TaxID=43982 RepID=A0ACB5U6S5_AMBMO|nr:unnamed protein product [Ambrosiozyma monospora]
MSEPIENPPATNQAAPAEPVTKKVDANAPATSEEKPAPKEVPTTETKDVKAKTEKPKKKTPEWIVNYNLISGGLWGFILINVLVLAVLYGQPGLFELIPVCLSF